ncbi:aminodeoxychorismate synthase component I [Mumia zhuanghuii]|uniref:Aminodeoxychorismate synthase component I n=1 Tax=Mumia zhuanghuii TaxID=2585211 RepID=A0A5C4MET2_9ACTN|nr:aminodeoxychorismate synthase component I [Mumia zhuanghuii]TNC41751.1 aminodeoxychorismate synthase component I [Mumia zhuanghuii]
MSTGALRRPVGAIETGVLLRRLRAQDRLVALLGAWDDGHDLVAYGPDYVLGVGEDPFDLGTGPETDGAPAGTWVGWWGYSLGSRLEDVGPSPSRPRPLPDADLARYDTVLRRGPDGVWWWESVARPEEAERRWDELRVLLGGPTPAAAPYALDPFVAVPGADAHRDAVRRAISHIHAGDLFQANICLRLESRLSGDPLEMFLAGVEALHPAYAAFVAGRAGTVVSLSPELYVRRTGDRVLSSPIKGTAPSDSDPRALAASVKDRAENVMIVDLVRNDLGRVARPGSVRVTATAAPRAHTGVWHLVSDVEARVLPGTTDADVLRASFPPGSVTGAPKVRAMQVIGELEATGREVYTGAIGYAGPRGLEANVAIRTFEVRGDRVWLGVGGGVVADSDPEAELRECFTKAAPLLRAVGATAGRVAASPQGRDAYRGPGLDTSSPSEAYSTSGGSEAYSTGGPARPDPAAGIFDTLLVRDGAPVDLEGHVARLVEAARTAYGITLDPDALAARAGNAAASLSGPHRLRLTLDPRTGAVALRTTPASDVPSAPWTLTPVVVPGGLGAAKWEDRAVLDTLAGAPWTPSRDPLLVDEDGSVLETGRGNVFAVFDDGVHTPSLDGRILPGVTREVVLGLLRERAVPAYERRITLGELAGAAELFVTNAIGRVRAVTEIEGVVRLPSGRTTAWLRGLDASPHPLRDPARLVGATPHDRSRPGARVLLIDNYDSFVHNLAQYVRELGADATVVRNDAVDVEALERMRGTGGLTHLVISPGPGAPSGAGVSVDAVRALGASTPILGVCLGHQAIGEAYGARVVRAARPVHGAPSLVHHDGQGVYTGMEGPLVAARYHSLVVEDLPDALVPTAWNAEGVLMGVRHREHPVEGVQIHPESILTPRGHDLLVNFLSPL